MGTQPMTPDQATEWLNRSEAQGRAMVLDRLQEQLQQSGMSPQGAAAATEAMSRGIVPKELAEFAEHGSKVFAGEEQAFKYHRDGLIATGQHWNPDVPQFSPADVTELKKISNLTGGFGTAIDVAVGLYEINHGVPPLEVGAKAAGGAAGAWAGGYAGAWAGSFFGPPGVLVGALIGGIGGAYAGEWAGQQGYQVAAK